MKRSQTIYWIFTLFAVALILNGCQSSVRFSSGKIAQESSKNIKPEKSILNYVIPEGIRGQIIAEAENWLGTPYCYGGETRNCIDCSGYIQNVFSKVGIELPRTSGEQYQSGKYVSKERALPGDLVFFGEKGKISHVGISLGGEMFIHASTSSGVVREDLSTYYFANRLMGFRNVVDNVEIGKK